MLNRVVIKMGSVCFCVCVCTIFAKYTTMVNAFQPCFPSKVTLYIATLFAFLSINMIKKFMTTFCIFHKNLWDTQE